MTFLDRWQDFLTSRQTPTPGNNVDSRKDSKVLFVMGKGGTGKTTTSASLATALAGRGQKVLVVSLDTAHNLGDVLATRLNYRPVKIAENLYGLEIDLDRAVKEYLGRSMEQMKSLYSYLQIFNLDQYLDLLQESPGIEEYAMLEVMGSILRNKKSYDVIIFDTAPTGVTLRVLALPELTINWIKRLTGLRMKILGKRSSIEHISGPQTIKLGEEKIKLPADAGEDSVLKELDRYFQQVNYIRQILIDEDCTSGIIVLNPDRLSALESRRALEKLDKHSLPVKTAIINRVDDKQSGRDSQGLPEEIVQLQEDYQQLQWLNQPRMIGDSLSREQLALLGDRIIGSRFFTEYFQPGVKNDE